MYNKEIVTRYDLEVEVMNGVLGKMGFRNKLDSKRRVTLNFRVLEELKSNAGDFKETFRTEIFTSDFILEAKSSLYRLVKRIKSGEVEYKDTDYGTTVRCFKVTQEELIDGAHYHSPNLAKSVLATFTDVHGEKLGGMQHPIPYEWVQEGDIESLIY